MAISSPNGMHPARPGNGLFTSGEPPWSWRVSTAKPVSYDVCFVTDLLDHADLTLAESGGRPNADSGRRLLVVDSRVQEIYGERIAGYFAAHGVEISIEILPAHEQIKTMDTVLHIVRRMDHFELARRREPVIAFGGGVLTDIVGLATSLYRRSTPYVRVPTTLIGLVDAGIGAKTGVNFDRHKNRLGSYHPSSSTLLNPRFLQTLDERQISNGLAEVLKIALAKDAELFRLLAEHSKTLVAGRMQPISDDDVPDVVLRRAVQGMLEELQQNLWEHQLQRIVDYGHSFSPTIEMQALPDLLHGEAVTIDMALTTVIACGRGLVAAADRDRILGVMDDLRLPTWHPVCTPEVLAQALLDTVRHRDGFQHIPLPVGIGRVCFVNDVTPQEIGAALAELADRNDPIGSKR